MTKKQEGRQVLDRPAYAAEPATRYRDSISL